MTAAYTYDGDGRAAPLERSVRGYRVKTVVNGTTITYIGNYFEWSNSVGTKYYYAGSVRVGVRVGTVLDYLFSDHLGSTSITADNAGNLAGGMRYTAWGETRFSGGATPTSFRYTGQRQAEAGLYYYVARMYDPALGRFISPDSMVSGAGNPQAYDRYAYALYNPLLYNDPSGHMADDGCDTEGCTIPDRLELIYREAMILQKREGDPLRNFEVLTEYAAKLYDKNEKNQFVSDMTCAINGYCSDPDWKVYQIGLLDRYPGSQKVKGPDNHFIGVDFFRGKGMWADKYYDGTNNQMYHFWFYVAQSYFASPFVGEAGAVFHDPVFNNPLYTFGIGKEEFSLRSGTGVSSKDRLLGQKGASLGFALWAYMTPDQVSSWIKDNLEQNP